MSSRPNLDRESFQQLLADAFLVQESQVDQQALSAVVEVERLIASGQLRADEVTHKIVDRAREVANATGVAVGVLEGNQLVYRAGSGSASAYIGRRFAASLIVSPDARREVLRVENADTDTRIEAAICRQFGAKSLLILPIYNEHTVVGLLEILFAEPHAFEDCETRAYRLMVGLIEEAITRDARLEYREAVGISLPVVEPAVVASIADRSQKISAGPVRVGPSEDAVYEGGAAVGGLAKDRLGQLFQQAKMVGQETKYIFRRRPGNLASGALATVFLLTGFIVFGSRRPTSSLRSRAPSESSVSEAPKILRPVEPAPAANAFQDSSAPVQLEKARASWTANKRVRVGKNEVDYYGDDVTVRHFADIPAPRPRLVGKHRVVYIGDDVTVRDLTQNPQ
jgi:GAF domain